MQEFPARVVFGPYGGEIVYNKDIAHSSGYAWQVRNNIEFKHGNYISLTFCFFVLFFCVIARGVEIVKFSSCPGTSKKLKCTCP